MATFLFLTCIALGMVAAALALNIASFAVALGLSASILLCASMVLAASFSDIPQSDS